MIKDLYDKLVNVLSSISVDKYIHVIVCIIISGIFMHIFTMPLCANMLVSIILTTGIGIAKEMIDNKSYGLFSIQDLQADIIGAIIGTLIAI